MLFCTSSGRYGCKCLEDMVISGGGRGGRGGGVFVWDEVSNDVHIILLECFLDDGLVTVSEREA